jgi:hypothetical protein
VTRVMGQFDVLPPDRASAAYEERVADMVHAVVYVDESLSPFLTVTTFNGQETAIVSVMSRIGRYVGRLGDHTGGLHGKTFGCLGELDATAGQLPALLQLPDETLGGSLVPTAICVPTAAGVVTQFLAMTTAGG